MASNRDKQGRFIKGSSGNAKGRPKARLDAAQPTENRGDGWSSIVTGMGTSLDKRQDYTFCSDVVDRQAAIELMRGDDVASRAVEKLPHDGMRAGFDLLVDLDSEDRGANKDLQEQIEERWKELGLSAALVKAATYERSFGGSVIMIGADDGQDLRMPLNLEGVKSVDFLTVFEAREVVPSWYYADAQAAKFREVALYTISPISPGTSSDGTFSAPFEIHESRLIKFQGIRVDSEERNMGWGDNILTRIWRVLRDFNAGWDSAGMLVIDYAQSIFKIEGLSQIVAEDDLQTFINRMKALEVGRSMARAAVLDVNEEFERKTTNISGLPELLDRFESRVAAAVGMPVVVLFGRSPAGLNATGASDITLWDDTVGSWRNIKYVPAFEQVTRSLLAELKKDPKSWSIKGRPLRAETANEQASTRKLVAETDVMLIAAGVLFPEEVAEQRYGGDTYSAETMVDLEAREELIALEEEAEAKEAEQALQMAQAQDPNPNDPAAQPPSDDEDQAKAKELIEDDE